MIRAFSILRWPTIQLERFIKMDNIFDGIITPVADTIASLIGCIYQKINSHARP